MKSLVISGFLLLLTSSMTQAQEDRIQILDAIDSSAIEGVHVLDLLGNINRVSNEDGLIKRPTVKGQWRVSHIVYQSELIEEWGDIDTLFLWPRRHELDTVNLYGFDLVKYLNQCRVEWSQKDGRRGISGHKLFRKRASTNGEITQLFQIQIEATDRNEIFLCGVDFAAEFDLKTPLQAGGYIDPEYLISQLRANYPIEYLLKYLVQYDITEVQVDPETVKVLFSGVLKDRTNATMVLESGRLVFRKFNRQPLYLEWVSKPQLKFKKDYSKRYRKRYSFAVEKNFQAWEFDRNKEGFPKIMEFNTSVFLFVQANGKMDSVVLKNQIISDLEFDRGSTCKELIKGKAFVDQLQAVAPSRSGFLLSNAEKNFLKINGQYD